jgi:hypothetical protein
VWSAQTPWALALAVAVVVAIAIAVLGPAAAVRQQQLPCSWGTGVLQSVPVGLPWASPASNGSIAPNQMGRWRPVVCAVWVVTQCCVACIPRRGHVLQIGFSSRLPRRLAPAACVIQDVLYGSYAAQIDRCVLIWGEGRGAVCCRAPLTAAGEAEGLTPAPLQALLWGGRAAPPGAAGLRDVGKVLNHRAIDPANHCLGLMGGAREGRGTVVASSCWEAWAGEAWRVEWSSSGIYLHRARVYGVIRCACCRVGAGVPLDCKNGMCCVVCRGPCHQD